MHDERYESEKYIENNPTISVIVPVYNSEKIVQKCLDSILQQSFHDFELIIVDDGSTDNSGAVCDRIAETDKRVKVFHEKNGGVSKARNIGIEKACGEWVTFVDHDDILSADAFSSFSRFVNRNDIDIIQGQVNTLRDNKEMPVYPVLDVKTEFEIVDIYEYTKRGGTYRTNVWGKLYRNELLAGCRFPVGHYCEDIYFNGLYFSNPNIKNAVVLKDTAYIYRDNDSSTSHKWNSLVFYDMCRVMAVLYEKVKKRTKSPLLISEYLQLFFSQYYSFKYNIVLRRGYKGEIRKVMSGLKRKYEKELLADRNISVGRKAGMLAMANSNALYRRWIIRHDPTMLIYEKNVKETLGKQ